MTFKALSDVRLLKIVYIADYIVVAVDAYIFFVLIYCDKKREVILIWA